MGRFMVCVILALVLHPLLLERAGLPPIGTGHSVARTVVYILVMIGLLVTLDLLARWLPLGRRRAGERDGGDDDG